MYILDGKIVASINDIAPTDIESVSVLKGAMAIKKYGEKAANGVVEIVSKKNAKKEGINNSSKKSSSDSTKLTVTIDGYKNGKVNTDGNTDVNMTVVVDGNKVTINGKEVSIEKLQEIKNTLPNNERLVEVDKNEFRKIERMNG